MLERGEEVSSHRRVLRVFRFGDLIWGDFVWENQQGLGLFMRLIDAYVVVVQFTMIDRSSLEKNHCYMKMLCTGDLECDIQTRCVQHSPRNAPLSANVAKSHHRISITPEEAEAEGRTCCFGSSSGPPGCSQ
jgi:hypothetical protein